MWEVENVVLLSLTCTGRKPKDEQSVLHAVLGRLPQLWTHGVHLLNAASGEYEVVKVMVVACVPRVHGAADQLFLLSPLSPLPPLSTLPSHSDIDDGLQAAGMSNRKGPTGTCGCSGCCDHALRGAGSNIWALYRRHLGMDDPLRRDVRFGAPEEGEPPQLKTAAHIAQICAAIERAKTAAQNQAGTQARLNELRQHSGVHGQSQASLLLPYWSELDAESYAYPFDQMHGDKNRADTLAHHESGVIQTLYPEQLQLISASLRGVRFSSRISQCVRNILAFPTAKSYANSYELHTFLTSGIMPLALMGNIRKSEYVVFRDLARLSAKLSCAVVDKASVPRCAGPLFVLSSRSLLPGTRQAFCDALEPEIVQVLIAFEYLPGLPSRALTIEWHRFLHLVALMRCFGPLVTHWCFRAEGLYGFWANHNHATSRSAPSPTGTSCASRARRCGRRPATERCRVWRLTST